jgi:ferritin-like metal-binding protein YciE
MSQDQLVAWLDDAYAMESGLIPILQNHARAFEGQMPEAAAKIREHISDTRRHADRLEQCLRTLNATPSTAKSTLSAVMGSIEGMSTALFRDELMKNALADYGAEQFEVACYTALVTSAMELGYPDIAHMCEQNLKEDEEMARWLRQQLPAVASVMLARTATPRKSRPTPA